MSHMCRGFEHAFGSNFKLEVPFASIFLANIKGKVPPFEALLKFHGGEGFEEVVPLSKTHRNSACLKG